MPRKKKDVRIVVSDIDDTVTERNFPFFASPNECTREFLKSEKERGSRIFYVTSRPKFLEKYTKKWLEKNGFPDPDNLFVGVSTPNGKLEFVKKFCETGRECVYVENHDKARAIVKEIVGARVIDPNDCNDFPD